jgi:hypothetical protein
MPETEVEDEVTSAYMIPFPGSKVVLTPELTCSLPLIMRRRCLMFEASKHSVGLKRPDWVFSSS